MSLYNRPTGVTILSFLMLISGLIYVILGILSFGLILLLGIAFVLIAIGLYEMKDWSRIAAILLGLISVGLGILNLLSGFNLYSLVNIIIGAIIIVYLLMIGKEFKTDSVQVTPDYSESREDIIKSIYGAKNLKSDYTEKSADFICPKCGSNEIHVGYDGSGECHKCKQVFAQAKKKSG